jgi:hypothetical protein
MLVCVRAGVCLGDPEGRAEVINEIASLQECKEAQTDKGRTTGITSDHGVGFKGLDKRGPGFLKNAISGPEDSRVRRAAGE